MKSLIALSLIAGLTLSVTPSIAQGLDFSSPGEADSQSTASLPQSFPQALPLGGGPKGGKMNLTDDQLENLYNLKNKLKDELGPKMVEVKKQKRHLRDLLTQETLNKSEIKATQSKINSLKADIANISIAYRIDMNDNLTADQRKKMRYRKMKPRKFRGPHGHRGHQKRMRRGFTGQKSVVGQALVPGQEFNESNNLSEISESI